jgi:cytoplasmic iron level regulating protein YaaA (DUF328/UPF0246 family)
LFEEAWGVGWLSDNPQPRIILPDMLFLLSPAKALDFSSPVLTQPVSAPRFTSQANALADILARLSPVELARLMSLSDKLAMLNVARFQAWQNEPPATETRSAVLAFDGDVYDGLNARSLDLKSLQWLQKHLRILSGLYGLLNPLDGIQPYRLEMGARLMNPAGSDLYHYWGNKIVEAVLADLNAMAGEKTVINLASQEYFKSVQTLRSRTRVVDCIFEERRGAAYAVVGFYAKRARGMMMRFALEGRVSKAEGIKSFDGGGYAYCESASDRDRWVFRRDDAGSRVSAK